MEDDDDDGVADDDQHERELDPSSLLPSSPVINLHCTARSNTAAQDVTSHTELTPAHDRHATLDPAMDVEDVVREKATVQAEDPFLVIPTDVVGMEGRPPSKGCWNRTDGLFPRRDRLVICDTRVKPAILSHPGVVVVASLGDELRHCSWRGGLRPCQAGSVGSVDERHEVGRCMDNRVMGVTSGGRGRAIIEAVTGGAGGW